MHEEQRERLRVLAASVNETARMARATNSLFLFVALYLALTLLSATDENLLRNGQVVLPQVGAGISVVESYVLAPFVFLLGISLFIAAGLRMPLSTGPLPPRPTQPTGRHGAIGRSSSRASTNTMRAAALAAGE